MVQEVNRVNELDWEELIGFSLTVTTKLYFIDSCKDGTLSRVKTLKREGSLETLEDD